MDLQVRIREIVEEHSGGIKLGELVTLVIAESCKLNKPMFDIDKIMTCIYEDPTLNAHEYVWNMGDRGDHREKIFVHQI